MSEAEKVYQNLTGMDGGAQILHVVSGPAELFHPRAVSTSDIAALIGDNITRLSLAWLQPDLAEGTHDVLLDDTEADQRVTAFLSALREDYDISTEPLVILPALSRKDPQAAVPQDLMSRLLAETNVATLHVYRLRLNGQSEPKTLDEAVVGFAPQGAQVFMHDLACPADSPLSDVMGWNSFVHDIARAMASRWRVAGFTAHLPKLAWAVEEALAAWAEKGLVPEVSQDPANIDALAARLDHAFFGASA